MISHIPVAVQTKTKTETVPMLALAMGVLCGSMLIGLFSLQASLGIFSLVSPSASESFQLYSQHSFLCDDNQNCAGEYGTIFQLNDSTFRLYFRNNYTEAPVVIAQPLTNNDSETAHVRIVNVTLDFFELKIEEWDYQDGNHANESVNYLVIEPGTYEFGNNGEKIVAGLVDNVSSQWKSIILNTNFANYPQIPKPIVLAQIQSANPSNSLFSYQQEGCAISRSGQCYELSGEDALKNNLTFYPSSCSGVESCTGRVLGVLYSGSDSSGSSGGGNLPPTSICGNGVLETGEECDDGNIIDNDGCNNDCTLSAGDDGAMIVRLKDIGNYKFDVRIQEELKKDQQIAGQRVGYIAFSPTEYGLGGNWYLQSGRLEFINSKPQLIGFGSNNNEQSYLFANISSVNDINPIALRHEITTGGALVWTEQEVLRDETADYLAIWQQPICNLDNICGALEDVNNCPADCGDNFADYLDPRRVMIVVNTNNPDSVEVGNYYRQKRGIPFENICEIAIEPIDMASISPTDTIQYESYLTKIREVVRDCLNQPAVMANKIYYLVTTKGVPFKISMDGSGLPGDQFANSIALDSSLALVRSNSVGGVWLVGSKANPYYAGDAGVLANKYPRPPFTNNYLFEGEPIYLVTRIDGPSLVVAKGLIDKALMAETSGISGNGCLDLEGTGFVLDPLVEATLPIMQSYNLPILIDRSNPVIGNTDSEVASCGPTMAYAGTYNNEGYFSDAFDWLPGAVALPLHSVNAKYLVTNDSTKQEQWVAFALEDGLTAAVASVAEPGPAMMVSSIFFDYWLSGYNFASAAYTSIPYLGYTFVAIGDPLFHIPSLAQACPGGTPDNKWGDDRCIPGYFCSPHSICTRCFDNDGDGFNGSFEGDSTACFGDTTFDCNDNDPTVTPDPETGECTEVCFQTNIIANLGLFKLVWDRLNSDSWIAIDWNDDGILESFTGAGRERRGCPPPIADMLKVIPGETELGYSGDVYVFRRDSNQIGVCKHKNSSLGTNAIRFSVDSSTRPEVTSCGTEASCFVPSNGMIVSVDAVLCAGRYELDPRVSPSIYVRGDNVELRCQDTVIIGGGGIRISDGNTIEVSGCTLENAYNPFHIYNSAPNVTLRDNVIRTSNGTSIWNEYASNITIENNEIEGNGFYTGIYVERGEGAVVSGNNITQAFSGIKLWGTTDAVLESNTSCNNASLDIEVYQSTIATAQTNTCTTVSNFNDQGYPGCTTQCPSATSTPF